MRRLPTREATPTYRFAEAAMSTFSIRSIDVPGTAYVHISADGVDAAGHAVGNYGDADGNFHGFIATNGTGAKLDPPGSSNTDIIGITTTGEIYGNYTDNANRQHGFVNINGVFTKV